MVEIAGRVMSIERAVRQNGQLIWYWTIWITINDRDLIALHMPIRHVIRKIGFRVVSFINNCRILHLDSWGWLKIYLVGAKNKFKEFLKLEPWGHYKLLPASE